MDRPARQTDTWVPSGATLYIDRDTRTAFPEEATLPLNLLRELLHEFMLIGKRPVCVDWQQTDIFQGSDRCSSSPSSRL
ncbi:Imm1 family immunity protein [Saccharothrix sp. Mg75]|uniref:Imm1 family immunity protein n=1 Tax=Saccharothrix sp. Mg75 TaxID=3445357 RepID=UPI003EEFBB17